MKRSILLTLAVTALAVAGCSPANDTPADGTRNTEAESGELVAIATTTPIGSVASEIAECAGATATSVMGPGDDPHTFQPSSAEVAELTRAPLVIANGFDLEEGLLSAIQAAESDGAHVLELAPALDPLPFGAHDDHGHEDDDHADDHGHAHDDDHDDHAHEDDDHAHDGDEDDAHGHSHGEFDPHFWLDASRMAEAAELIGAELAEVTGDETFATCGTQVHDELLDLDASITETLSAIPDDSRILVTDHEAFGYFAARYDFEIAGVVVPGGSTDAEPSSADLAALVGVIEDEGVSAIFSNTSASPRLVEAVAAEVGRDIAVVPLFVESTGPEGSGAETYTGMMTHNATAIAEALSH